MLVLLMLLKILAYDFAKSGFVRLLFLLPFLFELDCEFAVFDYECASVSAVSAFPYGPELWKTRSPEYLR
jgi:hypothetical protein